jgi:hypothetical protein
MFEDEEKQHIMNLMNEIMAMISTNTLAGITQDKKAEAKFIDDSVKFWNKRLKPELKHIMEKVNKCWDEKSNSA